jgi:hypothetical protein
MKQPHPDRRLSPDELRMLGADLADRMVINSHKFGRKDPAYIAPSAHDHLIAMLALQRGKKPPRMEKWSCEELEGWVRKAPSLEPLMARRGVGNERSFYDDQARLAAKWAIEHLETREADNRLRIDPFWEAVRETHPRLPDLMLSSSQKDWAFAAAIRVFDSYRV